MSARRHNEHAALVEGRGVEAFTPVATVAFVYPDDGEIEPPVVRDRWTGGSMLQKCQRPFQAAMLSLSLDARHAFVCSHRSSPREHEFRKREQQFTLAADLELTKDSTDIIRHES
jgi:hypothetical protein